MRILVGVGAALLVLLLVREPLGRWWFPQRGVDTDVAAIEQALGAGQLDHAADALARLAARDPDAAALWPLRRRWQEQAEQALEQALKSGAREDAQRLLSALRAQGVAPQVLRARETRLLLGERRQEQEAWLQRAQQLESRQADAALAIYRVVLAADPANALARDGQRRLLQWRLDEARREGDRGAWPAAEAMIAEVVVADPLHPGLPEVSAWLGQQGRALRHSPEAGAAASEGPDRQLAMAWRGLVHEALGRRDLVLAETALQAAERLEPGHAELVVLRGRLATLRGAR